MATKKQRTAKGLLKIVIFQCPKETSYRMTIHTINNDEVKMYLFTFEGSNILNSGIQNLNYEFSNIVTAFLSEPFPHMILKIYVNFFRHNMFWKWIPCVGT